METDREKEQERESESKRQRDYESSFVQLSLSMVCCWLTSVPTESLKPNAQRLKPKP
jgi:hypothetical protein